ncbi:uncharacterized protein BYT42DRAFT_571716 [Radiomyces spectabilis]|uniref:uncharacterized protein n=1 Tax=Radiomyces spectabilis TaxID=64574 RepID=UPI00222011FC|nr:uncharacterized protein BYT42DRAFT_571716 [Radiomyces spectabilis]KAI8377792.1 hypothetical protein BYT42DRAFT_571716 [Radiomyces spectabilis]
MPSPHALGSQSINPSKLMELEVLSQVVSTLQAKNDFKASIPYLAKMAQIVDNQQIGPSSPSSPSSQTPEQRRQQQYLLDKLKADAHARLADAYYKTGRFIESEASLSLSVKLWETLMSKGYDDVRPLLMKAYDSLGQCYEALHKPQMVKHMQTRKQKLVQ